jgi:hypothetical protein
MASYFNTENHSKRKERSELDATMIKNKIQNVTKNLARSLFSALKWQPA